MWSHICTRKSLFNLITVYLYACTESQYYTAHQKVKCNEDSSIRLCAISGQHMIKLLLERANLRERAPGRIVITDLLIVCAEHWFQTATAVKCVCDQRQTFVLLQPCRCFFGFSLTSVLLNRLWDLHNVFWLGKLLHCHIWAMPPIEEKTRNCAKSALCFK